MLNKGNLFPPPGYYVTYTLVLPIKGGQNMKKYLIEVPHRPDKIACIRAVYIFKHSGSHFLTHANWGCHDGEHKAWLFAETDNKEDAMRILPIAYRQNAKITEIKNFSRTSGTSVAENLTKLHH
jgi:hypothetical protein